VSRYARSSMSYSFGPGPITPAVRALIIANVAVLVVNLFVPAIQDVLGLTPFEVLERGRLWQLATYMFVHSRLSFTHILFNMLTVWMMGVDLERRWGTQAFTRYYFVCGVGAAICVLLACWLPFQSARASYSLTTIGASGAVYGVLLAWAMLFPERRVLLMFLFPVPARTLVLILGGIAFLSALSASGSGVSNVAHLGGLLAGWIYLKGPRNLNLEWRYRLTKWRMARLRRKFNVHQGGKDDWEKHIH
jgi:membrane associated rhomboid family serine protease